MKFKVVKNVFIALLALALFSCSGNKYEKKIIGNWYNYNQNKKLSFNIDTLTIYDFQIQKTTWTADAKQIKYDYKNILFDSISKVNLNYSLKGEDTLLINNSMVSSKTVTFIKAESYLEYLFKKNKINIDLAENGKAII